MPHEKAEKQAIPEKTAPVRREGWTLTWQAPGDSVDEWCSVQRAEPERFQSVPAPAGGVGHAFRAHVLNDEEVNSGWRAEGVGPTESAAGHLVRYEWATWFPPDYPVDPPGQGHIWQVITQWHQQDEDVTGISPPIAFIVVGEEIRLHLNRVDPTDLDTSLEVGQYRVACVDRATWHHFAAEVLWALEGGSITVWHNNNEPQTWDGIQTLFPLRRRPDTAGTAYLKMGLYRARITSPENFEIYHDEVRRLSQINDQVAC